MKNLLIYVGPNKSFSREDEILAKIQIDNSLDLGWKREDILLFTDFPFEYQGIRAHVLTEDVYYPFDLPASKIPALVYLLKDGLLEEKELYWLHDFDAFENYAITEEEIGLDKFDVGFTHYFYKPQWQCASIFFKTSARDIFELLNETTYERPHSSRNNEKNLTWLTDNNKIDSKRYKKLNPTYNFTKRYIPTVYKVADKPLKVLHFRPSDTKAKDPRLDAQNILDLFMYQKNRLKITLMSDRLIRIFNYHGIK